VGADVVQHEEIDGLDRLHELGVVAVAAEGGADLVEQVGHGDEEGGDSLVEPGLEDADGQAGLAGAADEQEVAKERPMKGMGIQCILFPRRCLDTG